jgi:hypothetical protein
MTAPPAPWDLVAAAIVWTGPPRGRPLAGVQGRVVASAGAMVSYRDTPVGPYHEVMGQLALLRGARLLGHVPFIAVDSPDSVEGGNANWFLPKTLAAFTGDAASGAMQAEGDGWRVEVRARALGPAVPARGRFALVQPRPDGREARSPGAARARMRPALVRVRVEGDAGPLRSGVFPGAVAERAEGRLEAPA